MEGLVDTIASKFVMIVNMVCKFGLMHLVTSSKMYKSFLGVITQAIGENRQAYKGWQQIVIILFIYYNWDKHMWCVYLVLILKSRLEQ